MLFVFGISDLMFPIPYNDSDTYESIRVGCKDNFLLSCETNLSQRFFDY